MKYVDLYDGMFVQTHYPDDNRMFRICLNSRNFWYWSGVKFCAKEVGCENREEIRGHPINEESYDKITIGWWDTNQTRKLNRVDKLKEIGI